MDDRSLEKQGRGTSRCWLPLPAKTKVSTLTAQSLLIYVQDQGEASPNGTVTYSRRYTAIWPRALSTFRIDGKELIFLEVLAIQLGCFFLGSIFKGHRLGACLPKE